MAISIHAPRTGSDPAGQPVAGNRKIFQSTLPARGATTSRKAENGHEKISIHAPRTGSDVPIALRTTRLRNFNPRSPHGERLTLGAAGTRNAPDFNPRSPHGERPSFRRVARLDLDFNPRSPHGERLPTIHGVSDKQIISIHAPRTGSDQQRQLPPLHRR